MAVAVLFLDTLIHHYGRGSPLLGHTPLWPWLSSSWTYTIMAVAVLFLDIHHYGRGCPLLGHTPLWPWLSSSWTHSSTIMAVAILFLDILIHHYGRGSPLLGHINPPFWWLSPSWRFITYLSNGILVPL